MGRLKKNVPEARRQVKDVSRTRTCLHGEPSADRVCLAGFGAVLYSDTYGPDS